LQRIIGLELHRGHEHETTQQERGAAAAAAKERNNNKRDDATSGGFATTPVRAVVFSRVAENDRRTFSALYDSQHTYSRA